MKRVLIGATAVLVLVVAIVLVRTALVAAPPPLAVSAPPIGINSMDVARHLAAAIRFKTISYGNSAHEAEKNAQLDALRNWMEQTYPAFHRVATREIIGKSLLFTWKGKDAHAKPILLMAHMDVVPVVPGTAKDWSHDPFSGDIADGFVWGRGAIDDKGCLIALLDAAERLAESGFTPERTIMFAFGQDEEVGGSEGNANMAKVLAARHVHFAWVLDEGGAILNEPFPGVQQPVAFIAVAEKGYLTLQLVAHGTGGHSSRPTSDLAIARLSDAVRKVVDHPFASSIDDVQREQFSTLAPYMPFFQRMILANLWLTGPIVSNMLEKNPETAAMMHTTIAPTMISGGIKDNVLPPQATATINFRLHQRDTIESVIEHVRKAIDDPRVDVRALTETQSEASKVSDLHDGNGAFIVHAVRESFNGIPVAPTVTTGATDSRHYMAIADDVYRLDPFHMDPDDMSRIHGTNERLAISDIGPAVGFYMRLMQTAK
ncbi:MAG: M20 family peptidase [Proteobacteria bacterium]|nr:M20 family peptidase [Pseudomonadota bacterium]